MTGKKSLFRSLRDYLMSPPLQYNPEMSNPASSPCIDALSQEEPALSSHGNVASREGHHNAEAALYMRGGADEPYCCEECYGSGGRAVLAVSMGTQQGATGKCITCNVATRTGLGREYAMAVPIRGMIGLFCRGCIDSKKMDAFIRSIKECAWCGKLIATENQNEGKSTNASRMNWEGVTGHEAVRIADNANIAPRGSFTACAFRWKKDGDTPCIVAATGIVACSYCGANTSFKMDGMGYTVQCSGCDNTYSIFAMNHADAIFKGRIIIASVGSHQIGSIPKPPELSISEVSEP